MTAFVTRTVGDVVAEILMSRVAFAGSLLVLEGDDDARFWRTRTLGSSDCQFVLGGSKRTVTEAVLALEGGKQNGILGIVDDDYDSLMGRPIPSVNLIRTETRDMETLMLGSEAFNRVLGELGDAAKIDILEQREGRSIHEAFISRALLFGQLRYLNAAHNWNVAFKSPWRFADVASWSFNRTVILQEVADQIHGLTTADLEGHLANVPVANPWLVLHGKDSLDVLAIGFRAAIGNQQHPLERILQMLRLAFDNLMFRATQLYSAVKRWESANPPYRLIPDR